MHCVPRRLGQPTRLEIRRGVELRRLALSIFSSFEIGHFAFVDGNHRPIDPDRH
jgi:hypothetical protein